MHPTLWIVQSNLGNERELAAIREICDRHGLPLVLAKIIPFSDDVPDVHHDGPVVVYGSNRLIQRVAKLDRWKPGVFFDEAVFRYANYLENWHGHMLNSDGRIWTLEEVARQHARIEKPYFLRPDSDLKEFAGTLLDNDGSKWLTEMSKGFYADLKPDTLVVVSSAKAIESEWRLFVVERKVVTGSCYRSHGRPATRREDPSAAMIAFAEARAAEWSPASAFVLDIAETANAPFKIVEAGGINAAGFYSADIERIIVELSRLAAREFARG